MKKLLLLSVLLLAAVAVSAQYASVSVGVTPVNDCWAACKKTCVTQKMSDDACNKYCNVKCNPQPGFITKALKRGDIVPLPPAAPVQPDCGSRCKLDFDRCLRSGHSNTDCARSVDMCSKKCQGGGAPTGCEDGCDVAYRDCKGKGLSAIGAVGPECDQMRRECYKKCQPNPPPQGELSKGPVSRISCDECPTIKDECAKPDADAKTCEMKIRYCINKCKPECPACPECPPAKVPLCEERCKSVADECKKSGADPKSCEKKIRDCLRGCQPQPPCEDRCATIKAECAEKGLDDKACEMKIRACWRDCQSQTEYNKITECPPKDCQDNCVDGYYTCAATARTMKAPAGDPAVVIENYMMKCRRGVAECLDTCKPAGAPGQLGLTAAGPRAPNPEDLVGLNPQPEPPMPQRETGQITLLGRIFHIFTR